MELKTFHGQLRNKMDDFVHLVYQVSRGFPREELYGVTSQLRRASLSVVLNYIEGYARGRDKVHRNFLEISYGSLKESSYLLEFARAERYLGEIEFKTASGLADDIGAMLWGMMRNMKD